LENVAELNPELKVIPSIRTEADIAAQAHILGDAAAAVIVVVSGRCTEVATGGSVHAAGFSKEVAAGS
jgi:hypothetical protein